MLETQILIGHSPHVFEARPQSIVYELILESDTVWTLEGKL